MQRLIDPDTALALVLEHSAPLPASGCDPQSALGLILAEDVCADRAYPPFPRAMMDGYAVRMADAGGTVAIVGEVAAGQAPTVRVESGTAVSIMTGAPCPDGTEAVVPKEKVSVDDMAVTLPADVRDSQHIALAGSECEAGATVARAGEIVSPLVIANLATFGHHSVSVLRRPRCAIITTGAELVAPDGQPGAAQIRASNGPMLQAMAHELGITDVTFQRAGDSVRGLHAALSAVHHADVVMLSGGVSAGKYDLVPDTLQHFGVEMVFHKIKQKPGKPMLFGHKGPQLFFGLPGNPLACHLGFHHYAAPALRVLMGRAPDTHCGEGTLTSAIEAKAQRTLFRLCRVEGQPGSWTVTPITGKGAADLHTACPANAYIRLEPDTQMVKGASIEFEWCGATN